jgi:hypothetical protein
VYNGHSWDLKNVAIMQRVEKKYQWEVGFWLVIMASDWQLLTGGCYLEVVVRTGLTACLSISLFSQY